MIGLGTWAQFDVDSSERSRKPLIEVLKLMAGKGAKLIDSSPMYGRAEAVAGDLTQLVNPGDYFYATKVWTQGEQEGIRQMQSSMQKMRRECMDLMQVHNLVDYKTHLKTLRKWKEAGKVRYIGLTHYTVSAHAELERIIKNEKVDFIQFNYSIGVRDSERSLLDTAHDKGVAVIINEPLNKGELFYIVKGLQLPVWAADYEIKSWACFFLKYIISHPAVNCAIPGTSVPEHMADILEAGYGVLPDEKGRQKMAQYFDSL